MASLRAHGALEACATLPSQADWRLLRASRKPKHYEVVDARGMLEILQARGVREPGLKRELRGMVRREGVRRLARTARAAARAAIRRR